MAKKHVNIDGDVILYAVGFACETKMHVIDGKRFEDRDMAVFYADRYGHDEDSITEEVHVEPLPHILSSVKKMLKRIVKATGASTYTVLLTGDGNFRQEVATIQEYKGNRSSHKPVAYHDIREYLIKVHAAEVCEGEEADDQLSIRAVRDGHIIATIDKDLNNTPGTHYNWNDDKLYDVGPVEADRNFYKQLLTGDSTDNIPGLFRIAGKRASAAMKAFIDDFTTTEAMYRHVHRCYVDALLEQYEDGAEDYDVADAEAYATEALTEIGQLLWMRREEGETWTPPTSP